MAAARERAFIHSWALLLSLALLVAPLTGCRLGDTRMIAPAGRERADVLAYAWARHLGASDRALDQNGDMSLGETGLYYEPSADVLYGRVWVNMARTRDAPPERLETYRRMQAALNDPRIGGMFERGNGYFVLDEQREGFFLVRRFSVPQTTPDALVRDMDRLQSVASKWTTKWFLDVAMIMHGKEKAPERPVLLEDD